MQCKLINFGIFAMHSFALQSVKDVSIKVSSPKDDACLLMYCRTASSTTASTRTTAPQTSHNMQESAKNLLLHGLSQVCLIHIVHAA